MYFLLNLQNLLSINFFAESRGKKSSISIHDDVFDWTLNVFFFNLLLVP